MEPEEIAVVLARASDLHAKLSHAIVLNNNSNNGDGQNPNQNQTEFRNLTSILDALKVLQNQLHALQVLQQQQRSERDIGLAKIEESRRVFLKRLKFYRGKQQEIVQEALTFAGDNGPEKDDSGCLVGDEVASGLPVDDVVPIDDRVYQSVERLVGFIDDTESLRQGWNGNHHQQNGGDKLYFGRDGSQDEDGSDISVPIQYTPDKGPSDLVDIAVTAANAMSSAVKGTLRSTGIIAFSLNVVKSSASVLHQLFGKVVRRVTEPTSKAALMVIGTLAVLSLADLNKKQPNAALRAKRIRTRHHHRISNPIDKSSSQHDLIDETSLQRNKHIKREIPRRNYSRGLNDQINQSMNTAGRNQNLVTSNSIPTWEDAFPICVVKERIELPFYRELEIPDVLNGQG